MKTAMIVRYEFNKDYYAVYLCENKETPEMNCNGKCRLAKELQIVDGSNDNHEIPIQLKLSHELKILFASDLFNQFDEKMLDADISFSAFNGEELPGFYFTPFQPPRS